MPGNTTDATKVKEDAAADNGTQVPPGASNATGSGNASGGAKSKDQTKTGNPPPTNTRAPPPPVQQVLQLTPELFQQTVAAAVTAALTAAGQQTQRLPVPQGQAQEQVAVVPRKEKKLADFWTSRPTMWFRLFDGQFPDTMSEDARFNALLNHLPSAALPFVDHILRTPGQDPFTRAKACLVRHYEVSPRDRARTLRSLTSLGDRTPSEMLYYMRSLLPGCPDNALFEAIFIDLLPANARDAAVKHELLEDMAEAADKVLAEAPSLVSSVASPGDGSLEVSQISRHNQSKNRDPTLCFVHARYGKTAYKCTSPKTCRMKDSIIKPPSSGNANAGRQ